MSLSLKHTYRFDTFVLDVDEQILLRDGSMVPLTPKVFETLLLLVRHQGSVVTKQTILETLWPDVFVEESNITFNITKLRKALGDTKRPSLYIETVPRRGYRFKTEVKEVLVEDDCPSPTAETLVGGSGRVATHELASTEQLTPSAHDTARGIAQLGRSSPSYFTATKRTVLVVRALFAVILLVIVAAASWRYRRSVSQGQRQSDQLIAQTSAAMPDLKYEQITTYGNVVSAAISPDGKQVAYVRENSSQESLWLIQLNTSLNVQLIPSGDVSFNKVSFSHDGNYLYFSSHTANEQTNLYRISVLHGPPTKLLENLEGNYSLSADDRRVVFKRRNRKDSEDTLYIAELDNGQERPLVTHKQPEWIWAFSLSPNGKTVVFATGETDSGRETMNVLEVDTETGQEKLLVKPNWYYVRQFEWLPEGDGLLVCGRERSNMDPQIFRMSYPSGALQQLTNDLNNYLSFSVNADASKMIAVQSQLASHIWVSQKINGSKARNVADGRGRVAWTADGRIIFNSSSVMNSSDLWIARPDGSDPKQLSFNTGFNDWPAISTDSRMIVFQSNRTGVQHLWRMNLDGSNQVQLTNGYAERNAAISPDGKWVYYNSSENSLLWKVDPNGGEPVQLTNEYAAYPSVSPDGKLIACFHFPRVSHEARITVRSADDMKTVAELTLAPGFWISRSIQWEADNSTLLYATESEGKLKLYRQSIYSGPPQEVSTLKGEDEFEFAFSPDHKQLAYISSKWNHDAVLVAGLK